MDLFAIIKFSPLLPEFFYPLSLLALEFYLLEMKQLYLNIDFE